MNKAREMSRYSDPSLGVDEVSADCEQSSNLQPVLLTSGQDKPKSQSKLPENEAIAFGSVQTGRITLSTVGSQFQNNQQAGKDLFPRFLFWARNRSRSAVSSVLRVVESIRGSFAKSLKKNSGRPLIESFLARPEREVSEISAKAVQQAGSKPRRLKRAKDRSELPEHLVTGLQGEQVALDYLRQQGWKLIDRNVRALGGEIDLVMLDEGTIVFVEVKTWGSKTDEDPAEAVDLYKQRTLTRAGLAFLQKKRWLERSARFDVVSVRLSEDAISDRAGQQKCKIRHFRAAFESQGDSFFG
jgi:putative endonuclease